MKRLGVARACAALVVPLFVLTACGGGGGGGGDSGYRITADHESVDVVGFVGGGSETEEVHLSAAGLPQGVYVGASKSSDDVAVSVAITGTSTATLYISPNPAATSGGRSTGNVTLLICSDEACKNVLASKTIAYTLTNFEVQSAPRQATLYEGAGKKDFAISVVPAPHASELTVLTQPGDAWMTSSQAADGLHVAFDADGLSTGDHSSAYYLAFTAHPQVTYGVPVTLTAQSGEVAPAPVSLTLDATGSAASTGSIVPVAFQPGVSPSWNASTASNWLVLTQASGSGSGNFGVHVDMAALQASGIGNGMSATANVTVHVDGQAEETVPVTLHVLLPQVTSVSPDTVSTGAPATLTIFGRGLAQPGALDGLVVAGATVTGRNAVSDTLATLVVAPLAAGRHAVSAASVGSFVTSAGAVTARAPAASTYTFLPHTGDVRSAIFDGPRNAIYAVGYSNEAVYRFQQVGGTWQATALAVAKADELVMSRDGTTLFVTSGSNGVVLVDPDTLTVRQTLVAPFDVTVSVSRRMAAMSTADGRVWLNDLGGFYDTSTNTFGDASASFYQYYSNQPVHSASADGSAMVLSDPGGHGATYVSAVQALAPTPQGPAAYATIALSADGRRRLVDARNLYDTNWNLVGSALEPGSTASGYANIVSPDGLRVYSVLFNDQSGTSRHIGVFDASALVPGTTSLVEVGTISLPDNAICNGWTTTWCDNVGTLMIDPAGKTLYWLGGQGLVVLPIPGNMTGQGVHAGQLRRAAL